jgi:hypothetical protein
MDFCIRLICVLAFVFALNAIGCSKKEVYEGMYEGIQRSQDKELRDNPGRNENDTVTVNPMSYERYQQERKKLIGNE